MATTHAQLSRRLSTRGFTLIELMVVLVIVSAMVSLLVIGGGDNSSRKLEREAEGLAALINLAADEAVMQGTELGLFIDDTGYRFLMLNPEDGTWQEVEEKPLQRHDFEQRYTLEFELDGERLDPMQRDRVQQLAKRSGGDQPMLILLSSGEVTPFRLTLTLGGADKAIELHSDGLNPVKIGEPG